MSTEIDEMRDAVPESFRQAWAYASALWKNDPTTGSVAVMWAWHGVIGGYSQAELHEAFQRLAVDCPNLPSLDQVVSELREIRRRSEQEAIAKLPAPAPRGPLTLDDFDAEMVLVRRRYAADVADFCSQRRGGAYVTVSERAALLAEFEAVGPQEQRARERLGGAVPPFRPEDTWYASVDDYLAATRAEPHTTWQPRRTRTRPLVADAGEPLMASSAPAATVEPRTGDVPTLVAELVAEWRRAETTLARREQLRQQAAAAGVTDAVRDALREAAGL